jgi:hypothetical protein
MRHLPISHWVVAGAVGVLTTQGCSSERPATETDESLRAAPPAIAGSALLPSTRCEGLDPYNCLLPWPSSRYLEHAATATGWRVALPRAAMPANVMGSVVDPAPWNRWDGFSPMTSMIAQLPVRIDPAQLVDYLHIERSLEPESATILVDATTRQRVAHWAEIERAADADPNRTTIYVRPAARLIENHHYVVAIRQLHGMISGERLYDGTPTFRALRDGTRNHDVDWRRTSFEEDVFLPLLYVGVDRRKLSLAWDFRTGSGQTAWGDLVAMQLDANDFVGTNGLGCTVTGVTEDTNDPHVFRRIDGTYRVPAYLGEDGRIARNWLGLPQRTGTRDAPFVVVIPRSVGSVGVPARLVVFGHGLMSNRNEVLRDFMVEQANRDQMVLAATDLTGLASGDEQMVAGALFDLNGFDWVMDRVAQSVVQNVLLARTIAGECSTRAELSLGGRPFIDGSQRYYYGVGQGASFGPTIAALSDDIGRFALSGGGINVPIMITRSLGWPGFESPFAAGYPTRIVRDTLTVMSAHQWERVEGSAFAPHVKHAALVSDRPKHVLSQVGRWDLQTPNEGSHIAARTLDLRQAERDAAAVFGLRRYLSSWPDGYVTFDFGVAPVPPSTVPPAADNGVHEAIRRDPRAQAQIDAFFRPFGVVTDVCNGPCK